MRPHVTATARVPVISPRSPWATALFNYYEVLALVSLYQVDCSAKTYTTLADQDMAH